MATKALQKRQRLEAEELEKRKIDALEAEYQYESRNATLKKAYTAAHA